ncbi:MAG: serine/threonine-protein kinase, partial [Gemmatimonadales bacterium]
AAASMDPVGLVITGMRGIEIPSGPVILWTYLPNYICALLAVLPSHVIARLGTEVKEARELGSYQVGDLLGRGGMGEVYAANHRMLRRPAAIKLVRPGKLGAEAMEAPSTIVRRFKREAEAAASLHSPHTIALYDFGVTDGGDFYYVMELLRGLDLETVVERFGPMPQARVTHLLAQACQSLAEAHAVGLVHRDVKPANLYTCWVGLEPDFVKVLDFGLVKGRLDGSHDQTKLTAPNMATGTPAYMSPELARGEEVDGRSDLYALGCVAYWMLTGRLVFEAESAMKTMVAHIRSTPLPPSLLSELEINPALDELVLACLEKDPADRPQDADELARRLAECNVGGVWDRATARAWWLTNLPDLVPTRLTI